MRITLYASSREISMTMEELNKTQLILLALLVSFVTSIATGIVTVALMDQAPPVITQTISRVVKETERVIVPQKQQATVETVIVKEEDYIVSAVEANLGNMVTVAVLEKRKSLLGFVSASDTTRVVTGVGVGFALTKDGVVAVSGAIFDKGTEFVAGTRSGNYYALTVLARDASSGLALAQIGKQFAVADKEKDAITENAVIIDLAKEDNTESALGFFDAQFSDSQKIKLGTTAVALGLFGMEPRILLGTVSGFGFVEGAGDANDRHLAVLYTTLGADSRFDGGPLLDSAGKMMGVTLFGAGQTGTAVSGDVAKALLNEVIESKKTEKAISN